MINTYRKRLRELNPLIHCITNPISINQCANTILAAGARPMMAEHPKEAGIITKSAGAVMLNLGNITDVRMESMLISAETAKENKIPYCLDICGAACLKNRRDFAMSVISVHTPQIIKGNYSEITALFNEEYRSLGVDTDLKITKDEMKDISVTLANKFNTTILASGETDIVTDGKRLAQIYNGSRQLTTITGTGCMQGALCAAFLSVAEGFDAAFSACTMFGICGELAEAKEGSGTFGIRLLDALSVVTDKEIEGLSRNDIYYI